MDAKIPVSSPALATKPGTGSEWPGNCPHSHLPFDFLKKIGKAVETAGEDTVKAAITVALSGAGAFQE